MKASIEIGVYQDIEKDENYCKIARKRIANVPERLDKFLK